MNFIQKIFAILVFVLGAILGILGMAILARSDEYGDEYEEYYGSQTPQQNHQIAIAKWLPEPSLAAKKVEITIDSW